MSNNNMPPDELHRRPDDVDDATVLAVGKVSEALETIDRARGALYEFHQLIGHADFMLDDAVQMLNEAGHASEAEVLRRELVGRNVLEGRWTFQIVEDFDDNYYGAFKSVDADIRRALVGGKRHLREAELKEQRRTKGLRHHESRPSE